MKGFSWKNNRRVILSSIMLLIIWEVVAIKLNNEIYLPRIEAVLTSMGEIIREESFIPSVISSFYRTIISFFLALILSIILGVLSLMYPFFKDILKPLNAIGKTIPTMVLVVLALIWVNKDQAPYIVGFAIVFPILYEGILNSLNNVDNEIIQMCDIYEVNRIERIKKIYLPTIKFYISSILMSSFSLAFKVVVAGEVHGQPKFGIGSSIQLEKVNFNTPGIFAWIVIIALISIIFETVNKKLLKRVYRWKNEA